MKCRKTAGPSNIVAEMLKASGSVGLEVLAHVIKSVIVVGVVPADWRDSIIVNLYKGKEDALDRRNYRGLKLTDHVMKIVEHVLERWNRKMVDIVKMQFGFVSGRSATDAVFIVRQLQEKYLAVKKPLFFVFVDLEKAFDQVPRKVSLWEMRKLGVKEWAVRVVQSMYIGAKIRVSINNQLSDEFGVNVGVHQGSVLSPLLFILVLEALSRKLRTSVLCELLYVDDLVLLSESLDDCTSKFKKWKLEIEIKGLRVSSKKTKFMLLGSENLGILEIFLAAYAAKVLGSTQFFVRLLSLCPQKMLWFDWKTEGSGLCMSSLSQFSATFGL